MKIAFTICNRHQLTNALCLGESLIEHNPDYSFCLGWVDSAPLNDLPSWVQVIRVDQLPIEPWEEMIRQYTEFELMAAIKPFLIRRLVATFPKSQHLIYFSPTTLILTTLNTVLDSSAFIQLTPNRIKPIDGSSAGNLDDKRILNIGMYHHGAIIFHPSQQLDSLLNWWEKRAIGRHYLHLCDGMALDQLWLNYLPLYFHDVKIIRNPNWQIGLHTLNETSPTFNKNAVISVDFAGITHYHPIWSNHTKRATMSKELTSLAIVYKERLAKVGSMGSLSGDIYGNKVATSNFQGLRKRLVKALATIVSGIEQFNLTHN